LHPQGQEYRQKFQRVLQRLSYSSDPVLAFRARHIIAYEQKLCMSADSSCLYLLGTRLVASPRRAAKLPRLLQLQTRMTMMRTRSACCHSATYVTFQCCLFW
jgi:hypothetical protein